MVFRAVGAPPPLALPPGRGGAPKPWSGGKRVEPPPRSQTEGKSFSRNVVLSGGPPHELGGVSPTTTAGVGDTLTRRRAPSWGFWGRRCVLVSPQELPGAAWRRSGGGGAPRALCLPALKGSEPRGPEVPRAHTPALGRGGRGPPVAVRSSRSIGVFSTESPGGTLSGGKKTRPSGFTESTGETLSKKTRPLV